ncbi:hypothetical protein NE237_010083 [Protea cynaroides]|uniref:Isopenicillin N synthase-like Fe(2+) 2OG dioxygenase domain-containing protein n=1 Tax=Protea cynaroides TaxID=273540 RepID=A0A9Q0R0W9_9MAGN|nr:hypothetical protein NE237_010083 [Protea cynaroides]
MASSAEDHHHHQPQTPYGSTVAPPSTPTTQADRLSTSHAADALSRLIHRLPPTLSLPTRLAPPKTSPPIVSFSSQNLPYEIRSSSSKLSFFQLTNHSIPSQLAFSAEIESLSLFNLPPDKKQQFFPRNWPLGFDEDEEDDGDGNSTVSLCLSADCPTKSTELDLPSLTEFSRAMEKVGLEIIEALSRAVGFENPLRSREDEDKKSESRPWSSLVWISEGVAGNKPVFNGRFYPYIVALQYQIRCRKYSLLADSGWVSVSPQVDSVLVTIGDIAQVWSNGKLKKVRGTAVASLGDEDKSRCISMSLLVTLPLESSISPVLPLAITVDGEDDNRTKADNENEVQSCDQKRVFQSFSLEDYAWRVYNERLLFKDPLDRYRT